MNGLLPPDASTLDVTALVWFFIVWITFNVAQDYLLRGRGIINQNLHVMRRAWMARMLERDNRMVDAVLVGHTMHSCTFFASTTILILAGLVGSFGVIDKAHDIVMSLTVAAKVSRPFFETKVLLLVGIFAYAFLKFTWALRQFNYCLALIGSAPHPPFDRPEMLAMAENIADTLSMAVRAFNGGMRSYYFALAALWWFIDPLFFMLAATGVVLVLGGRQGVSNAARHIKAQRALLEKRGE
ncbi:MAG TPA: DUF599 family protein [Azospirillaceae bacterium]|nr:DUF599 family protein [Azospirillaceae bacterium]HRQ80546.1 DUF599 family protein [Azospirillaceae bacterium]